jgi:adenosylcobinamide kinase/adenosylcobinamide-phosphate guanylyltransferase
LRAQARRVSLTFITGPVRSGKSRLAERLAIDAGGEVLYVATARADANDPEWVARIAHHAARRPRDWRVIETAGAHSLELAELFATAATARTLLVDSLGTWLADRMSTRFEHGGESEATDEDALEAEIGEVVTAALATSARAIVVGEEVGWGLVPPYRSGRVFRDVLGRAQQRLATRAEAAFLVVSGRAIDLSLGRIIE